MKQRILGLLDALDMRPTDFAARLGIGKAVVSKWTAGLSEPSAGARTAICATFGVNRAWLDNGDGDMFVQASPTLENATFEELQLAFIRAMIERLPEEIQERVLATVRVYVEEKNRRAKEIEERARLEKLQAEVEEARASAQAERERIEQEERAAQAARDKAARDEWERRRQEEEAATRAERERRKASGAFLYQSKVYGNVGNVDNLSISQPPAPVPEPAPEATTTAPTAPDAEKAELDAMIARLQAIRDQKLKEAQAEEERSKKRGK